MALPTSTANWHWKNKNVTKWGQSWFEKEILAISSVKGEKEGEQLTVTEVKDVDGDIELGQRKSKLITIYDCKITLGFEGNTSDGSKIKGTIHIPEVSHEITCDKTSEYSYYFSPAQSGPEVDSLISQMRKLIPPLLEEIFERFPAAIVDAHGKDLTVSADPSRAGTPSPAAPASSATSTSSAPAPAPAQPAVKKQEKAINTSTVKVEASFMASADDLFGMLTDEKRIPMWTRAAATSAAKPDTEYTLFGGGVKGKYISLEPPKKVVQTWVLQSPTWPEGHIATLTTTFDQSSESTALKLQLEGVPKGMEDEIRRNLEGYYIHGLKSIGLGSIL